jgi:hypothetical protein
MSTDEKSEKLELLGRYLEETGYKTFQDRVLRVRDNFGDFIIGDRGLEGTKIMVCGERVVDLADPESFPLILATIRFCKSRSTEDDRFANASDITDGKRPAPAFEKLEDFCDSCPLHAKS